MRHQIILATAIFMMVVSCQQPVSKEMEIRKVMKFTSDWKFNLGDEEFAYRSDFDDLDWVNLDLPHDWSINEPYDIDNPGGFGTSFMIGGIGWYRKAFMVPEQYAGKRVEITFDGVYQNSEVYINGHKLGKRPFGYITFKYDLTPHLQPGELNFIAVKVDNSDQPNSRWYSGSGIYRNVWLTVTDKMYIDPWCVFVTTPEISDANAVVNVDAVIINDHDFERTGTLHSQIISPDGILVANSSHSLDVHPKNRTSITQQLEVKNPVLWDVDSPNLYTLKQTIFDGETKVDDLITTFGIRSFHFDSEKGFFLNGRSLKIKGVCMHHDLGALGAAVNVRAMQRQLEILQDMGVNAIRTAHNPPAPELLHLTDRMGFIVMNETFDTWQLPKVKYDYSVFWDKWHGIDLRDHVMRDRNHPSVMIWSIGNEILEQWHPQGTTMTTKLAGIVRELDSTRPITAGNNHPTPDNTLIQSGKLDLIGYNYDHEQFEKFLDVFPGEIFIAAETTSALATRGSYDMPSDSIRRWPYRWYETFLDGNADNTCSAYDNCSSPWGSTHAESWLPIKKHDFLSGMFIWTGFDYLGEPTPYEWPSRSSYFGIVDLAGFPKDAYYMYQSEWTNKTVLHIFPHWNWEAGEEIDVWAYYNNADEVELFLNGASLGVKSKGEDDLHVQWRVNFEPGTLRAVSRMNGQLVKEKIINSAGEAARMSVSIDRDRINAGKEDLSFITIDILDAEGNLVPRADNLVKVTVSGSGSIAGVDNGDQTNHQPFQGDEISAFNGKCLVILRSGISAGSALVTLQSEGLPTEEIKITIK